MPFIYLSLPDEPIQIQRQNNYHCILYSQTILLGDSGVGKTSLLVQFETGKFQAGNFSATVGIGFTVSDRINWW